MFSNNAIKIKNPVRWSKRARGKGKLKIKKDEKGEEPGKSRLNGAANRSLSHPIAAKRFRRRLQRCAKSGGFDAGSCGWLQMVADGCNLRPSTERHPKKR